MLGPHEVAALLGVKPGTVAAWLWRGVMVAPDATISGVPLWRRDTIVTWAAETGRGDSSAETVGTPP